MRVGQLAAGLALGVVLVGCGDGADVSAAASARLTADVARLRTATTSGTSAQVASAADALRSEVAAQQAGGDLSSDRAALILDQLARVLADAAARPVPTPRPVASPAPAPADGDHHGKKKGRGEGERD